MRIPFATVLFICSVFILMSPFVHPNSVLGMTGGLLCIGMLVYSIVLYSNLDMPMHKY